MKPESKIKISRKLIISITLNIMISGILIFNNSFICFSQNVGASINTTGATAAPSAILDVSSINHGILIPRMTEVQKNAIISPATGLMIYQTDEISGFWYYNGSAWVQAIGPTGAQGVQGITGVTGSTGLLSAGSAAGNTPYWDGTQWVVSSSNIYNNGGSVGIGTNAPDASAAIDIYSINKGVLIPRMGNIQRNAILNPADGLQIYNVTTNCLDIFVGGSWQQVKCGCTAPPAAPAGGNGIASTDHIFWYWNDAADATGYKWNTVNNYNSAYDIGKSNFFTQTGLFSGTNYSIYIWAYNLCGNSVPLYINQNTDVWECGKKLTVTHTSGTVAPETKTVTYGTRVSSLTGAGRCWISQNLGADHQASAVGDATEASAGWYWQFNRKQGYKHTGTTVSPAWTITSISETSDWVQAEDPCYLLLGIGWRLPTDSEWVNADAGWSTKTDAYASELKLHAAGTIYGTGGPLSSRGMAGWYWGSTQVSSINAYSMAIGNSYSNHSSDPKSAGSSARCLK